MTSSTSESASGRKAQSCSAELDLAEIRRDYEVATLSRQLSEVARKEVALGRAGFVILGEGKELAQIAMAKVFQPGDWRSGYYRDQTFMLAAGALTPAQFFAQVYAHGDVAFEPSTGGRQMNAHYASRYYTAGTWHDQTQMINVAADLSCTAGQLPRLIGLGYSSWHYRQLQQARGSLEHTRLFSHKGQEVAFGTIGDAATAEGHFWETVNAMGVLQIPVAISVWDNGYGISVPTRLQTTKGSLANILPGFAADEPGSGVAFYQVKGWDYVALNRTYQQAIRYCRRDYQPCVILVDELTQPLGHSSSGNHARYKSAERLQWEQDHDCLAVFKRWIVEHTQLTAAQLQQIDADVSEQVQTAKDEAYAAWQASPAAARSDLAAVMKQLDQELTEQHIPKLHPQEYAQLQAVIAPVLGQAAPSSPATLIHGHERGQESMAYGSPTAGYGPQHRSQLHAAARRALALVGRLNHSTASTLRTTALEHFVTTQMEWGRDCYRTHLFSGTITAAATADLARTPQYSGEDDVDDAAEVDGREIIRDYFHAKCGADPRVVIMGEDVGGLGGVNLEFEGLQAAFPLQVIDTGIRELTILGQGHGMAMRGFRPVVDIQYLDYLLFCLQGMSDDIACLHYRSAGGQVSPVIIRTKGHRLMGIWHSGSPMAMIMHACRGIHLCTPRDMTRACGMYETLLHSDDPGIVIEPMNGYRKKEPLPKNLGRYHIPLGQIEILRQGEDVTLVTYGACCAIVMTAAALLWEQFAVAAEVIDCQTLQPFDQAQQIKTSLRKTTSLIIIDEDVPGGASAYILQQLLEVQQALAYLDTPPLTLTAAANRPAYSSDGDYYCKPQVEDVLEAALKIMRDKNPAGFA